jgi:predicted exporter
VYRLFGGRPGQWIVLGADRSREGAAAKADAVAEALEPLARDGTIDGYDALATFAPSPATQRARLAVRDALDLPALRPRLEAALVSAGFDLEAFGPALAAFTAPAHDVATIPEAEATSLGWIVGRHLREDAGETLAVTYVRPSGDAVKDERALAIVRAADPSAVVTGYGALDADLRKSLARDLPKIAVLALVLVAAGLRAALGRVRDVAFALGALAAEIVLLGVAMRVMGIHWHVYDALVVPVLLGITIDEAMFLLYASRDASSARRPVERALLLQGPLVASTALTTAAGFGALLVCRFEGLRDLGAVGAIGSIAGLFAALVVVPAGLRLADRVDS